MLYVVMFNEEAKQENVSLDDYLIMVNVAIMHRKIIKAKLANENDFQNHSDRLANLVSFRGFPLNANLNKTKS